MHFLRAFLLLLCLPAVSWGQAVWGDKSYSHPLCANDGSNGRPLCEMCWGENGIAAQLSGQRQPLSQSQPSTGYTLKPVTRQVKRCNGRTCWYETVTEYVRVPLSTPTPVAVESSPDTAPARLDFLHVDTLAPTPQAAVDAMLAKLQLDSNSKLFDLGCGDGRFLVTAAKRYACSSVGIEMNADSVELARKNASLEFVTPLVTVFEGDILKYDLSEATHVVMYLYPQLMAEVWPQLKRGTVVASYLHPIQGATEFTINGDKFYVGRVR